MRGSHPVRSGEECWRQKEYKGQSLGGWSLMILDRQKAGVEWDMLRVAEM